MAVLATRPCGVPALIVPDVPAALAALAAAVVRAAAGPDHRGDHRVRGQDHHQGPGRPAGRAARPDRGAAGSYNNEIGHPLTVLGVTGETRYLISEMSARGPGHIAALCRIAPPRLGAVLCVGHAHAGEFGGIEQVAPAKGELPAALPADGVAVLNADDPRVVAMAARTAARVVTFGTGRGAGRGRTCGPTASPSTSPAGPVHAGHRAGAAPVRLRLHGAHHVSNALAAAALAAELGMAPDAIAAGLSAAVARSRWRMEVTERDDGVTVVNDAYNANPESIRAALAALADMTAGGRRGFAVLGQMTELGEEAQGLHEEAARLAAQAGVAALIVVGEAAGADPGRGQVGAVLAGRAPARGRRAGRRRALRAAAVGRRRRAGQGLALGRPAGGRAGAHRRAAVRRARPVKTILVSAGVSLLLALFGTPAAIKLLRRRGYGQLIREEGPAAHQTKRGTPTMGGAVIVVATLIGYLVGHVVTNDPISVSGLLVLFLMTGLGLVGFIDDFIKIYKQTSLGLRSGAKLAGQAVVGALFAIEVLHHPDGIALTPADAHFSFLRDFGPPSACCRSCCGSS